MNSTHLAAGAEFPPHKEGNLRIYSNRFCPFSQKVLLVAIAKGIPLDIVNLNLKSKPEWLSTRNLSAKVPSIETANGPLHESTIVAEYLDEAYPNNKLTPSDPYQKALDKIWVENSSKIAGAYMKVIMASSDNDDTANKKLITELAETLEPFEEELKRRGTLFFGGLQPKLIDYLFWPWFERIPTLKFVHPNLYDFENSKAQKPHLESWRKAMKEDNGVKATFIEPQIHYDFVKGLKSGSTDYELLHK